MKYILLADLLANPFASLAALILRSIRLPVLPTCSSPLAIRLDCQNQSLSPNPLAQNRAAGRRPHLGVGKQELVAMVVVNAGIVTAGGEVGNRLF